MTLVALVNSHWTQKIPLNPSWGNITETRTLGDKVTFSHKAQVRILSLLIFFFDPRGY